MTSCSSATSSEQRCWRCASSRRTATVARWPTSAKQSWQPVVRCYAACLPTVGCGCGTRPTERLVLSQWTDTTRSESRPPSSRTSCLLLFRKTSLVWRMLGRFTFHLRESKRVMFVHETRSNVKEKKNKYSYQYMSFVLPPSRTLRTTLEIPLLMIISGNSKIHTVTYITLFFPAIYIFKSFVFFFYNVCLH